jgi:two-component system, OmpR family, alkaline phosphatase synthesis response regulator PhoP
MAKRVLVVDDEEDIVALLRYNLEKEGYEVSTALDGERALEEADGPVDLIVLDVMMPGLDGFEVCRRLRSTPRHASTPIMFLTARAGEFDQVLGLELGADDYIQKPISPRVFVARVRSILRRSAEAVRTETIVMPEILKVGELEINRQNYTVRVDGAETFFPKKEFELLAFLVSNPGKVFSREALLNRIWGQNIYVLDRTVDVHISKVREKLGGHSALIETVKGVGYRFRN